MSELSGANAVAEETAALTERVALSNKHALELLIGSQQIILEEMLFASNEALDRARTETHLFAEFVSKLAGVHSVKGIQTMVQECGQHQLDFVRRDCDRLFRNGQRLIDASVNLVGQRWRN
ncbi:hypothetical protein SSBR45G_23810 [Bradyrhizobium sp. SSBR45G]|uniref:hypothetical protein n=1 Tax=unclassified Bradyrhizobium TaxID=2631580 RepID=UPI002342B32A|nr:MULTISPECIES: hypothetical protein [unclassified Bradyrhizobium]GLH77473.1 hypothetical protein SSBR45G_23810 [Bradyrhizobium sp. SSBR45G]GLH84421.1 hypothetical protein SSBR45R_18810 [Bradyrhizobium sp. SSBR45R]